MTELNLGTFVRPPLAPTPVAPPNPWKKRAAIAIVLSLLAPGLGQVYLRRIWRGVAMALATALTGFLITKVHILLLTFPSMVIFLGLSLLLRIYISVDPFFLARREKSSDETPRSSLLRLGFAALVVVFFTVFPVPDYVIGQMKYFGAFKIPSASMCPTICEGDRIVADREFYKEVAPRRGQIILLRFREEKSLFIKRVIGVAGDTVAPGQGDDILVNGQSILLPEPCGQGKIKKDSVSAAVHFDVVKVPKDSLFVIGDNLNNSFDSRIPGFGFVNLDQVRGKPLYLYWSAKKSRIGCPVR